MHRWLWINGWGMDDRIWNGILDVVGTETGAEVEAGAGASLPSAAHGFVSYDGCTEPGDFLQAVQKELRADPEDHFTLVGWSMGGLLALQAALEEKESELGQRQIQRLVLVGSTSAFCDPEWGWSPRVVRRMKQALAMDPGQVLRNFREKMFTTAEIEQGMLERFADQNATSTPAPAPTPTITPTPIPTPTLNLATLQAGLDYLIETRLTDRLMELTQPTLIVHGELDAICPVGAAREMANRISGAKLVIVPGAGHMPFFTERERFLMEMRKFHHETYIE